jgi:hypothetical protein
MLINALEAVYLGAAVPFVLQESKSMPQGDRTFMEQLLKRLEIEGSQELSDDENHDEFIKIIAENGKRS